MPNLKIMNISKTFGEKRVIHDLSFSIEAGDTVGFLGPNGAGKSTTIKMIASTLTPDTGFITFDGKDTQKESFFFKKELGLVPQEIAIFEDMTAYENVKFFSSLYSIRRTESEQRVLEALSVVGLVDYKHELPQKFSGGMKRRLNIACAIAHRPSILIMDEPTVGIDPQSRNNILETVRKLNKNGTSVLYVSHYMEEVESICNKVVLLDHGEKLYEGRLSHLLESRPNQSLEAIFLDLTGKDLRDKGD